MALNGLALYLIHNWHLLALQRRSLDWRYRQQQAMLSCVAHYQETPQCALSTPMPTAWRFTAGRGCLCHAAAVRWDYKVLLPATTNPQRGAVIQFSFRRLLDNQLVRRLVKRTCVKKTTKQ
jgi:hypothetical protein